MEKRIQNNFILLIVDEKETQCALQVGSKAHGKHKNANLNIQKYIPESATDVTFSPHASKHPRNAKQTKTSKSRNEEWNAPPVEGRKN